MNQPSQLSESDFLTRQASEAKESAFEALSQAKHSFQKKIDPRPLLRNKPIMSVIGATLAGFLAVIFTVPSKRESELLHLERKYRATHPDPAPPQSVNGEASPNGKSLPQKQTIWATIIHELVQLIRPVVLTAITSSLKGNSNTPPSGQGPDKSA